MRVKLRDNARFKCTQTPKNNLERGGFADLRLSVGIVLLLLFLLLLLLLCTILVIVIKRSCPGLRQLVDCSEDCVHLGVDCSEDCVEGIELSSLLSL